MITTYERGILAGERGLALFLLEAKFGVLAPHAKERVETLSHEELVQLLLDSHSAQSLKELRLED